MKDTHVLINLDLLLLSHDALKEPVYKVRVLASLIGMSNLSQY